ncbi:hypothetical protein K504DRAFT_534839 [Pleomassaria siparia CBS 279.74]|uniref:Uncharacterized protein n=1 Tax=Pleomassaria siparia CBS 279.74 TaxID=1314801 RepID=A0A6G1K6X8_9PLEO|nr:hypothetical protein K504DRAFT_534839 [Pleomassaria siparia CBS 279.74]
MAPRDKKMEAEEIRVYISGFHGLHSLEVGCCYFFRGHYVYGPAQNPIEFLPFATRKKMTVMGTAMDRAPVYERYGVQERTRVEEHDVGALRKSIWFQRRDMADRAMQEKSKREAEELDEGGVGVKGPLGEPMKVKMTDEGGNWPEPEVVRKQARIPQARSLPQAAPYSNLSSLPFTYSPLKMAVSLRPADEDGRVPSPAPNRNIRPNPTMPHMESRGFTPNDRGQFLAASAPVSRLASPFGSRPVSPEIGSSLQQESDVDAKFIWPMASTARLHDMLAKASSVPVSRQVSALSSRENLLVSPRKQLSQGSLKSSRPLSRELSRPPPYEYLKASRDNLALRRLSQRPPPHKHVPTIGTGTSSTTLLGLGHPALRPEASARGSEFGTKTTTLVGEGCGGGAMKPTTHQRNFHIGVTSPSQFAASPANPGNTGRPRKASLALNEAYNRDHPTRGETNCTLHGEECDGVSVANQHLTAATREGRGFKDLYPTIEKGDRVMLDWHRLVQEESL